MRGQKRPDQKITELPNGYGISGNQYCVTLYREKLVKKTGKKKTVVIGYYNNIPQAFDRILDIELNSIGELTEISDKIRELKRWCNDLLLEKWQLEVFPGQKYIDQYIGFNWKPDLSKEQIAKIQAKKRSKTMPKTNS